MVKTRLLDPGHRLARAASYAVALGALIGTFGCGEGDDRVRVGGEVSYEGEPLGKGLVTFFPVSGRPVNVPIADDGSYRAELSPGDYTVVVNVAPEYPEGFKEGDPLPQPEIELPPRYTSRVKSRLKATVTADQAEPIDFALE